MKLGNDFRTSSIASALALALGSLLLMAGVASAAPRDEVLRWTHPSPQDISRFEAFVSTTSQSYGDPVSLGLPQPDSQGVYTATIEVDVADDVGVYIVLRAVDSSGEASIFSNERFRAGTSGGDPVPPPPPPPDDSGDTGGLENGVELPANPNALLHFDFNSGTATNWVDTAANNSLTVNDQLFTVTSVGGNPALSTQSTATNIHSHFNGNPSSLNNLVYTGRMATNNSGGGVGVTAYSKYPSADVYYRLRSIRAGEAFELSGHPNSCAGDVTNVVAQANTWYLFEIQITNESVGNRIAARVWKQGNSRPVSPQVECVDSASSRALLGTIGVWSMGSGSKFWDDLQVVTESSTGTGDGSGPIAPPRLISIDAVE